MCGRNIQEQISQLREYNIPLKISIFGKSEIRPNKGLINKRSKIFYVMLKELITKFQSMNIDYCMDYSGLLPLMRNEKYGELSDIEISFNLNHLDKVIKVLNKNKTFQTKYIFIKKKNLF